MPVKPMRLPKKVDVLGSVYSVRAELRPVRNALLDKRHANGVCDDAEQCIVLDGEISPEKIRNTLCHEILHAIDYATNDHDDLLTESDIQRIGHGLDYVLKRNPEFVRMYAKDKS